MTEDLKNYDVTFAFFLIIEARDGYLASGIVTVIEIDRKKYELKQDLL